MPKFICDVVVLDEEACLVRVGPDHAAIIDRMDLPLVDGLSWYALVGYRGRIYAHAKASGTVYMHRLIAGTPKGLQTDHINGNSLDNRRANLRQATAGQNTANGWKPARPNGRPATSRFKGVSWDRGNNCWIAKIQVQGRSRNLGRFRVEEDAARAYDQAAVAAWGEFPMLNLPGVIPR